jgi:cytochrome b561
MTSTMKAERYGAGARFFHWLFVLLLLAQVPAGIAMVVPAVNGDFENLPGVDQSTIDSLYVLHKGLGAVLLVVVLLRLVWRLTHKAPPLPASMPELERRLAGWTHAGLYFLMVLSAASGYVHVIGLGFPIEWANALGVPPLLPKMPGIAVASSFIHRFTNYFLIGFVGVHVAEVMRHHWVLGDGMLGRMWPPFGGGSGGTDAAPPAPARTPEHESATVGAGPGS